MYGSLQNVNASRPSGYPLVKENNVNYFRWDHRLQRQIPLLYSFAVRGVHDIDYGLYRMACDIVQPRRDMYGPYCYKH